MYFTIISLFFKEDKTINVFLGEEFIFLLKVLDQNDNKKVGFYTYPSNMLFTTVDVTETDLTAGNEGHLAGCLVRYNEPSKQCSEGRRG